MKKILILSFLILTIFLSGCWDARDIGDIDIAMVGSFDLAKEEDKTEPEDRILVALQVPVVDPGAEEKSFVIESSGKTVGDTRPERASRSFRYISFSELRVQLFGEDLARKGLKDELDTVFRNPFLSYQTELAVTEGYARDLLKIKPITTPNIGLGITQLLESTNQQNFVPKVTLADFRNDELSYGRQPVLPMLSTWKENSIQISGVAIFKDGQMVGKFDSEEMKYLILLRGNKSRGTITFPLEEGVNVTLEGTNSRKVDVELIDGFSNITIDIYLVTDIVEVEGGYIFDRNLNRFEKAQQIAEDYIFSKCEDITYQLQNKYQVDSLNTGEHTRAKYGKAITKLDEDELFSNANITVNVHVKIRNYGAIK